MGNPTSSTVTAIDVLSDSSGLSLSVQDPAGGTAAVLVSTGELPRLLLGLLRGARLLRPDDGIDERIIYPIEKGSIALSQAGKVMFIIALPHGADFAFEMDWGSATSLQHA